MLSLLTINNIGDGVKESNWMTFKTDLLKITQTPKSRNFQNIKTLNTVANYIKSELTKVCDSVAFQPFQVNKTTYKNVIGSIGTKHTFTSCSNEQ